MSMLMRLATARNILILFLLFLLANLVVIPAIYPTFQTLDTLPSYSSSEAYALIQSYGEGGRQTYAWTELTLDVIYPLISALLFSLAILYTFRRAFPSHAWTHWLALLPFGVMVADYLENACVVAMLILYPRQLPAVAALSNVFTAVKFALTPFELLFAVGLLVWLVRILRQRRQLTTAP